VIGGSIHSQLSGIVFLVGPVTVGRASCVKVCWEMSWESSSERCGKTRKTASHSGGRRFKNRSGDLTRLFVVSSQSLHANARTLSQITPQPLSVISFSSHYSPRSQFLVTPVLNESQINKQTAKQITRTSKSLSWFPTHV
jgi:hypothetical protein